MSAYFWLGAEGEDERLAKDSTALRNLTDLFRRVSALEFQLAQMKPGARDNGWGLPNWPSFRVGSPSFPSIGRTLAS